jgi:Flp pilus assembly protein TadG
MRPDVRSERGAILIFVGLAVLMLTAFSAFVLDYGVMWLSRRQAQNAADAGALAGAISRLYDEPMAPGPVTEAAALGAVGANPVFGAAGGAVVDTSDTACPAWATGGGCVRVDVHRDGTNASTVLPAYFANLFGVTSQSVRATATAQVRFGNASDCLKPFAVSDFYTPPVESYTSPGYTIEDHLGTTILLKGGPGTTLAPGWFRLLDLVGGQGGGVGGEEGTRNQIRSCVAETFTVGETLLDQNGNEAAIRTAIEDLYNLDPGASWDGDSIEGSCVEDHSCMRYTSDGDLVPDPGRTYSPRVMALPVFDPLVFQNTGEIVMVNILGFFLETQIVKPPDFEIYGTLVLKPDMTVTGGAGTVDPGASFLRVIQLIQ